MSAPDTPTAASAPDGSPSVLVVGGGPAGLTAALELTKHDAHPVVIEKTEHLGGISRTQEYHGYRFDIGGHRFYTKVPEVEALWHEILGDELKVRSRLSRIFYHGKFYPYPLKLIPTLRNLGFIESLRILGSYLGARLRPSPEAVTLEDWVIRRFGERLYRTFFKTYTEKVWGIPCDQIRAEWAAQRIRTLSLRRAVMAAVVGSSEETSLISSFLYPELGPGQMWERCAEMVEEGGGTVRLNLEVTALRHEEGRVREVVTEGAMGELVFRPDEVINSMPINHLIRRLDPPPPEPVLRAADQLRYRDFIVVALVIDRADLFPDNWIYVHSPEVEVGRIQNFKNWSPAMVPDPSRTCLGMEYFCTRGDGLWESDDQALLELAAREIEEIGLGRADEVLDGTVIRQPMAYPVYDSEYEDHLETIRDYLGGFTNLQTVGRAGMHRYNNQDHSMLTGLLAARNIMGEDHAVWKVNVERSYYEAFQVDRRSRTRGASTLAGDRRVG